MAQRPHYFCPNNACEHHHRKPHTSKFYKRIGTFITRWNHQPVRRYRCKACGKTFSSHTFRPTYRQAKPYLNRPIFLGYCSGTTQRRLARNLGCNPKTVARKFLFLARHARLQHEVFLRAPHIKLSQAQFDEMESFEHTRLKPLAIPLAVSGDGKWIVDVRVGQLGYKGRLVDIARRKYGPRPDQSGLARARVWEALRGMCDPTTHLELTTDAKPVYKREVRSFLGDKTKVTHLSILNRKNLATHAAHSALRKNIDDKLFFLNHTAARIRHDLSRMMRKVWTTTKKVSCLQAHLDLYIAYHNQYALPF